MSWGSFNVISGMRFVFCVLRKACFLFVATATRQPTLTSLLLKLIVPADRHQQNLLMALLVELLLLLVLPLLLFDCGNAVTQLPVAVTGGLGIGN